VAMEPPTSLLRTREQLDVEEDGRRGEDAPFQQQLPALFELMRQTEEKVRDIERDSSSFDVQELELLSRADVDARVRAEQNHAVRLAKEGAWTFFVWFVSGLSFTRHTPRVRRDAARGGSQNPGRVIEHARCFYRTIL
jgi:hypothetical protein